MTEGFKGKSIHPTRRTFLKASGLVALGTALPNEVTAQATETETQRDQAHTSPQSAVDMVNLLQGTNSTMEFSRGNTLPIAALPFGMGHWTLQSHADTPWMFQPGVRRIQGFRCTHQLSPWLDDYGYATFLPFKGDIHLEAGRRASSYDLEAAHLTPYSLQLFLLRYRAHVELVPTERCAVLTAKFDEVETAEAPGLLFDIPDTIGVIQPEPDHHRISFTSKKNAGGVPENFATYYVLEFPGPWESFEVKQIRGHQIGVVRFRAGESIEAKIGTSFISFEQAALNIEKEIGSSSVPALREAGAGRWNEHLHRVEIEGASRDQQRTFYSCMYRALLFPRIWHEPDARGEMHHFSAFNGKVMPGVMYADHGYWDVYRAWYPLMSILFPERLGEILQAWVNAYKEGGWLPQFPSPGYRACMTGSLIDSVFGDAAAKGITGFNLAEAYEGLRKQATVPGDPAKGFGRVGVEDYLKLHYIPANRIAQSMAETVDAAYGDFCIAQVAKALGKQEDYAMFMKRSENWRELFDPKTKFLRGKNEDGSWETPFDPFTWGSPYVEGSAWQHRWDAPQNISGLIDAMGGKAESAAALEQMLTTPPIFNVGVYGAEIHEMSEMAAVPFGQYAQSNQPSHHMLYIFPHAGRPDRTQFWARKVMKELYTPDNFPGDEDTGSMAAWYILSTLGFYQVCPGKPEYTLGSPLFTRATIHLSGNKTFVVEAAGNSPEAVFVRSVSLNGQPHSGQTLEHATIMKGGAVRFNMVTST
ncbi:GH92 family glycosyl hydrolase [Edaphobacter paludis]|uniref:GH92 family glycosyl hydrolase n=1 Tax=Edaphobacter paludis TaxID=3035702 RepID=A0AAU7D4E2_9BACT